MRFNSDFIKKKPTWWNEIEQINKNIFFNFKAWAGGQRHKATRLNTPVCVAVDTEQEKLHERSERERQQAAELVEFPHRRRTLLVAGVTVATVMMTYALLTGLWKVKVVDDMVDQFVKVVKGQKDEDAEVEVEFAARYK